MPEQGLGPVVAEAQRQDRKVEARFVVPQVVLDEGEVGEQPAELGFSSNLRRLLPSVLPRRLLPLPGRIPALGVIQ